MKTRRLLTLSILSISLLICHVHAYLVDNNPYRHIETLDKDGKFRLEWLVDWEESRVIFNVTVETEGYIGLGLSRKGKMSGADIVIGGVLANGQPYFSDRHAVANQLPVEDESQDLTLHAALETSTHTFLSFSRPFETCDEDHDLPIDRDTVALLWAFGEKDNNIEYHHQNRGVFYTYLLDPDLTPRELEKTEQYGLGGGRGGGLNVLGDWKVWTISHSPLIPAKETTYLCSIHKSPANRKQHVVGARSILPTEKERRHIHHFLLYRCIPPVGQDASRLFERLLDHREECYVLGQPEGRIPTQYCTEVVHVWAVGQRPVFFPDHVGIPIYPNEYFMLQMHYTNLDNIPGIQLNHALEIFYTENLRKHDAGMLAFGELPPGAPSIMVPPNSLAHEIYGHCAAGCTKSMFPPTGIRAFASNLHTHLAGRGVRLIHIRDNEELPWISYDDNYNFNYQQIRILREERVILPGDTLIDRCVYENADREGNVTIGGFPTLNEMCAGFLWYYDKIPDRSYTYRQFLQIYNTTWSQNQIENVVTSPPQNAGLLVSEVGNLRTDWTLAKREQIQEYHRYLPQISTCPSLIINEDDFRSRGNGRANSWFSTDNSRITSPQPPLIPQRYAPPPPIRRVTTSSSSFPTTLRRPSSQPIYSNIAATQEFDSEINDPETEFVSIYPKNIVRYQRPSICAPLQVKK